MTCRSLQRVQVDSQCPEKYLEESQNPSVGGAPVSCSCMDHPVLLRQLHRERNTAGSCSSHFLTTPVPLPSHPGDLSQN